MAALFEAYITNLGKYNEGELVGETLKFPTTTEEVQALLKRIGVDGVRYEEFFITSFGSDVLGLYDYLTEYENLDELNHLACLLSELDQSDLEKFEAVIDSGEHTSSVADRGFALGHHSTAPSPYVTWACYDDDKGQRQYEWGHYGNDLSAMEKGFAGRVQEYQRLFKVKIAQVEAPGLYKYYSTQRPVDIGTFPKPPHNAPDEIVNYDQRVPVEGGAFLAWGHLTYTRPLTERQASDYKLRPAPVISELLRDSGDKPRRISEQLRAAQRQAHEHRGMDTP